VVSKGAVVPCPPIADPGERQRRFEVVYAAHRGPILGYVLRRTGNPDDAADVIAETFLTAWRRLDEIPHDPQTRLWLYGVARRVLANHHRGERRRSALADRLRADLAVGYHPPEFDGEQAQISEAFRGLPAADRELLALSAWEGLGYGQIAVVLGCSRNAVRLRLFRARKRFAAELAGTRARSAQSDVHVPHGGFV
jgi:RNA polymerase sigma factor (sigma-70 family)